MPMAFAIPYSLNYIYACVTRVCVCRFHGNNRSLYVFTLFVQRGSAQDSVTNTQGYWTWHYICALDAMLVSHGNAIVVDVC